MKPLPVRENPETSRVRIEPAEPRTPAARQTIRRNWRDVRAVTLVEIMVAMGLLAFLSVGIIGITFQIRSTAEQAVYQNTALTLAQGYMEQIRHLDYPDLRDAAQGIKNLPINRISGAAFTLAKSTYTTERVYLDQTPSGQNVQPMDFHFQILLTSLETVTAGSATPASGVEVAIDYDITYNYGVTRTYRAMLRSVRSSVPLY